MTDPKTAAMLTKIKNLMGRTESNGCTEAEALTAAEMVAKLMDKHGFSMMDVVDSDKEKIIKDRFQFAGKQLGPVSQCNVAIGVFCDCRVWVSHRGGVGSINYFGRESDTQIALYITHLFHTAMESAWEGYKLTAAYANRGNQHGKTIRNSFMLGMSTRLNSRLLEIKTERNKTVDTASGKTGKDLMIVKGKEVDIAFRDLGMKLSNMQFGTTKINNYNAFSSGQAAANNVSITTGISTKGGYATALIGRK